MKRCQAARWMGMWIMGWIAWTTPAMGQTAQDSELILQCLKGYYEAYSKDPQVAASFYGEPVTIVSNQVIRVVPTRQGMEEYLSKSLAALKPLGYAYSGIGEHRIQYLNAHTALFSVMAMRYKADGTEQMRAGFTYLVRKVGNDWKIYANIATDLDKLPR